MASGLASDEVAEDYKNSLEDLTLNSRYEISNLTVIAKENMDHALAISKVIENHIRNAPPNRKLPALYVLDSVVKNVGTPYTLFFGRNLYQTFMNAYTLVDGPVRKKLEEMLKTWKEPVPGSLDKRPVFPPEVTRNIENALIKARTAAIQLQQQQARTMQGRNGAVWRSTPTPPVVHAGMRYGNAAPAYTSSLPQQQYYGNQQEPSIINSIEPGANPALTISIPQPSLHSQQLAAQADASPYSPPSDFPHFSNGLDALHSDLSSLVSVAQARFASNPYDQDVQQQLKALLDLKSILQSQNLPPDQLKIIRAQVANLSAASRPTPPLPTTTQATHFPLPQPRAPPPELPPQQQLPVQPSASAQLQSILSQSALAALLAPATSAQAAFNAPPAPTPPPAISVPTPQQLLFSQQQAPPVPVTTAPQAAGENPLLASLRAAGLLPPVPTPPPVAPLIPAITKSTARQTLPLNIPSIPVPQVIPPPPRNTYLPEPRPALDGLPNDVNLTATSLKIPRPHLISSLYEARPNQCTTCGRRFPATDEGRRKKAKHLDWHFKVNIRMIDATKRGQHRSWYVDLMEWIKSRDDIDEASTAESTKGPTGANAENGASDTVRLQTTKEQYIPVPNDPAMANITCPICQERFETVWHDDAQEWVWMDAVRVGARVFHASCHAEASKGRDGTPSRGMTPTGAVLGKRKAENGDDAATSVPVRAKVKRELVSSSAS